MKHTAGQETKGAEPREVALPDHGGPNPLCRLLDRGVSYYLTRSARMALRMARRLIWKHCSQHRLLKAIASGQRRLHIGCRINHRPGWLNCDISNTGTFYLDARNMSPLPSGSLDFIYNEHFIEHLSKPDAKRFLQECWRVLKPGGVVRLTTPDLAAYARAFVDRNEDLHRLCQRDSELFAKSYEEWLGEAEVSPNDLFLRVVYNLPRDHLYLYEEETLTNLLRQAGFREVRRCAYGVSAIPTLNGLERHEREDWVELMARYTLLVEAQK